jgi:hypothetical protein
MATELPTHTSVRLMCTSPQNFPLGLWGGLLVGCHWRLCRGNVVDDAVMCFRAVSSHRQHRL